jgi:polyphosphate kinase
MREGLYGLIDREIAAAGAGQEAWMILKMNSLEDPGMIEKLYEAARAGVRIRLVVRGICCLVPGVSDNIDIVSIIDRFLEHARVYVFCHGGEEKLYLASADMMNRNLSHRVEVAFPIYDAALRRELRHLLHLQCSDNTRARRIDAGHENAYVRTAGAPVRAQVDTYWSLKATADEHPGVAEVQ